MYDKEDAYKKYVQLLTKHECCNYYGYTFFPCVQVLLRAKKQNSPIDLFIGFSETFFILMDPITLFITLFTSNDYNITKTLFVF